MLCQGLSDWRNKLNEQVCTYQDEMTELNNSVKSEVGQLRSEFNELRSTLRQQMELTVALAKGEAPSEAGTPAVAKTQKSSA